MSRALAIAWLSLAACGAGGDAGIVDGNTGNDAMSGDANQGCAALTVDPAMPQLGDHVRVSAQAFIGGVLTYAWTVDGVPNTSYEAADHSAIGFDPTSATTYHVAVEIMPGGCHAETDVPVTNPTGLTVDYRVRVVPPADRAPPQEVIVPIHGGTNADRPFLIDPGMHLLGQIKNGSTPIAAYLRFMPVGGPAFDTVTATGSYDVHVPLAINNVLIIPEVAGVAPRLVAWMPGGSATFVLDAGTVVTGTVVGRTGTALAGAKVQLESGGVPSTIGTTDGGGAFSVLAAFPSGMPVTVTVTPPATSGLARLEATGMFDVAQSVAVSYAGSPATCDLSTTPVQRGGANQAGATVAVVGTLAGTIGTVTTGATSANATGTVHVAAVTGGGGTLPSTIVPRSAALSAVVELSPGDLAVAALDTSACAATTITAPARIAVAGTTRTPAQSAIAGVHVQALPIGALAMASLVPVETTSTTGGAFALQLASGAHYELRFFDPNGRGAPLVLGDVTAAGVPATADLVKAVAITGDVTIVNDPNPVENASVQVLCMSCTGLAASQPIAQTATDIISQYRVAVPDPGM